jgi:Fic family protein
MEHTEVNDQPPSARRSGEWVDRVHLGVPYRAFDPLPLPPDPPLRMDDELHRLLRNASAAVARLNGASLTLPNPDILVYMYVRKEAVLSSQIEGTQSSLDDLLAAEASLVDPDRPADVDEVINYVHALQTGLGLLPRLPISVRMIRDLHRDLLAGVRGAEKAPGEIRRHPVYIGDPVGGFAGARFVPTPPDRLLDALSAWERFVNDPRGDDPLVRIALAHAQFETIHPFGDGNGRVGRLLIAMQLVAEHLLDHPLLYLSIWFKEHRQTYYDRLQATRTAGDFEGWVRFFLEGVAQVGLESADTVRKIVLLREKHRDLVLSELGQAAANGLRVLDVLYARPFVSAPAIAEAAGITTTTTNALLDRLQDLDVLVEVTGHKRNRRFVNRAYIRLFDPLPAARDIPQRPPTEETPA